MKTKEHIKKQVAETFEVLNSIEPAEVNHFFKHKILQKVNVIEEKKTIISWFTPQLQLATLSVVLLLNASVILYSLSNSQEDSISDINFFAQEYALQSDRNSILN